MVEEEGGVFIVEFLTTDPERRSALRRNTARNHRHQALVVVCSSGIGSQRLERRRHVRAEERFRSAKR